MKARSFFSRVCNFRIIRHVTVLLVVLAWSSLAFCDEIHAASTAGDLDKVKMLLKDNPDLAFSKDTEDMPPLRWAALTGQEDVVELLLANKADVSAKDNHGNTPLHVAAGLGKKDAAVVLLTHKSDVNAANDAGETPLHLAVTAGHYRDVIAKDQTPSHLAVAKAYTETVEFLRPRGGHD